MRAEHLPYRLLYFLSPVGSLGGFAGCSSISSPLILLDQQELPRRRPGSTHREAPINLGELDKLCTVPRPLSKTDVWKGSTGKLRRILREALARSRALYKQLVEVAHQESSYILEWPPLLFIRAANPPLQPWSLWKSWGHIPEPAWTSCWRHMGSNALQSSQTNILLTAVVSCRSGHQHHPARVQISPWLRRSNSTLGVAVDS